MANIDELSSAIGANKEAIEQANTSVAASMSSADELSGQFQSLGSEDKVGEIEQIKQGLEQLQQALAGLVSNVESIHAQAEALRG
ncbi:hypothetical protein [Glycomyces tenuis]|uniref:hypothetical protein n=1 Tax=Glycomyces tenuis TaxID=58116 RepID=UPI0003F9AF74|nr:hypothetical protein [Glycomyces tenuis]